MGYLFVNISNFRFSGLKPALFVHFNEKVFNVHISLPVSLHFNGSYHSYALLHGETGILGTYRL